MAASYSPEIFRNALDHVPDTVLIVLRDSSMREAAASLLRICGYRVLTAQTGPEAERIARLHPAVGFVLTEQVLGGCETGAEVIDKLRSMLGASLNAILFSDGPVAARAGRLGPGNRVRIARIPVRADEILSMMNKLRQIDAPDLGQDA